MNEFNPDWDAMAVMVEQSQEQAAKIEQLEKKLAERSAEYDAGVTACIARLHEMHRITTGRHNFYGHAALELAKLKEME